MQVTRNPHAPNVQRAGGQPGQSGSRTTSGVQSWHRPTDISDRMAPAGRRWSALRQLATRSLEANVEEVNGRSYLTAGREQFRSMWTRDFAYAVPGLLAAGRADVARDHLKLLLTHVGDDGALPRSFDDINPKARVVLGIARRLIPSLPHPQIEQLQPEYIDQHGQQAIDGNALVILATLQYAERTGDHQFLETHRSALKKLFRFYETRMQDGLVHQGPHSDWQDSVKREGATFYTNLLYLAVRERLQQLPGFDVSPRQTTALRRKIESTFRDSDSGLYFSVPGGPQISLDGNLLALELGVVDPNSQQGRDLYAALKAHPLWRAGGGIPGGCTMPDYAPNERSLGVRAVGLRHYHDKLMWSWLTGLAAKTAARMGDHAEADRILQALQRMAERDGSVGEVYEPTRERPLWQSLVMRSEAPFAWGSGVTLDAVAFANQARRAGATPTRASRRPASAETASTSRGVIALRAAQQRPAAEPS